MPLRALQGDTNVFAYKKSAKEWAEIKKTYKEKDLRMPCCSSRAVPKTSRLGNYFFSHHPKSDCTSAPESPEHLYIKAMIAEAAIDAGWEAVTEFRGSTPTGAQWIADVMCTKNDEKLIVEIQLSGQSPEDFCIRQRLYIESNVRSLWLASRFNRKRLKPSLDLPIFGLGKVEIGHVPIVENFDLTLTDFIHAVFSGLLSWRPEKFTLLYVEDQCWKCRKQIRRVRGWIRSGVEQTTDELPFEGKLLSDIRDAVGNEALRNLGLCAIESSKKAPDDVSLLSYNACPHCRVLQNNWARMARAKEGSPNCGKVDCKASRKGSGHWIIRQNATNPMDVGTATQTGSDPN